MEIMKVRILKAMNRALADLERDSVIEVQPNTNVEALRAQIASIEACDDVTKHPNLGKLFTPEGRLNPRQLVMLYAVADGPAKGVVFTTNLEHFDLPNLEIRNVPLFLIEGAYDVLNATADYLLNSEKEVKLGQTLQISERCAFRFERLNPVEGTPPEGRWTLTELTMVCEGERHGLELMS